MITINDSLKKFNGHKEIEIDAPHGINIKVNGVIFHISKGDHGILVNKVSGKGSSDIIVEQEYANQISIN